MGRWFTGVSPEDRKRKVEEKIIGVIIDKGWITWSELYRLLEKEGVSRATLTKHLKSLVEIGAVERRVDTSSYPPKVYYRYSFKSPTRFSEDPFKKLLSMKLKELTEPRAKKEEELVREKEDLLEQHLFKGRMDLDILIDYVEYFLNKFFVSYLWFLENIIFVDIQSYKKDFESVEKYKEELKEKEKEIFDDAQQLLEIFKEVAKCMYNINLYDFQKEFALGSWKRKIVEKKHEYLENLIKGLEDDVIELKMFNIERRLVDEKINVFREAINKLEEVRLYRKDVKRIEEMLLSVQTQAKTE
jgi:DNA-binding transcriptional ArsR family regulator